MFPADLGGVVDVLVLVFVVVVVVGMLQVRIIASNTVNFTMSVCITITTPVPAANGYVPRYAKETFPL